MNENKNENNDTNNINEDIFELNLLNGQLKSIYAFSLSQYLTYTSTIESIQLIYNRYSNNKHGIPNPDIPALQAEILSLIAKINITQISIIRYNNLYQKSQKGEINYSLKPNIEFILANLFGIISSYYSLSGAIGIYNRDGYEPIIGI